MCGSAGARTSVLDVARCELRPAEGGLLIAVLSLVPSSRQPERMVTVEVPVLTILPLAKGVPAVGRTRTFCQVSEQVTPFALAAVIVKVI